MTTLDLARPPGRTAAAPPGHRWLMLAVLLGGQFMALIDAFVVNVAMPSIGADLHASGAALQLVVGGYSAAYAMLLITGARPQASDAAVNTTTPSRYMRRRPYKSPSRAPVISSIA